MTATPEIATKYVDTCPEPNPPPTSVIVDASNIAFAGALADGRPRLKPLCYVIDELQRFAIANVVIADASLRHRIDDRPAYEALVRSRFILQAPAGTAADRYMVLLAQKRQAEGERVLVLTDDRLADQNAPGLKRMTYMVVGDNEVLFDPPLKGLSTRQTEPYGQQQSMLEGRPL